MNCSNGDDVALNERQKAFVREYLVDLNVRDAAIRSDYSMPGHDGVKDYYVYALVDPRSWSMFYIGKGKRKRYASHVKNCISGHVDNAKKYLRIREIIEVGMTVGVVILGCGLVESVAYQVERSFIRAIGKDRLTNASSGQVMPFERSKALLNRIMPFDQWASLRPRHPMEIRLYQFVATELAFLAGMEGLNEEEVSRKIQTADRHSDLDNYFKKYTLGHDGRWTDRVADGTNGTR